MAQFLKAPPSPEDPGMGAGEWRDEEFEGRFPCLREYLAVNQWQDGTSRETTTLFMFTDGGVLKLMLKDRSTSRVAFFTSDSFMGLLDAVEAALMADRVDWRVERPSAGKRRT